MPIRTVIPKEPSQLARPQRLVHEWNEVENIPFEDGPRLPRHAPDGKEWHPWAVRKWRTWRRMPHARQWTEADWDYAFDSVAVAHRFYNGAGITTAGELRLRENEMGTTFDARRSLRIKYIDPKPDKPKLAVVGDDYADL